MSSIDPYVTVTSFSPTGDLTVPVLNVTNATPTVFLIEWSEVEAASHYYLFIRKQGDTSESQEMMVYSDNIILTDLSPNSTYCFSVAARNSASSGPESEPVCVQTGQ